MDIKSPKKKKKEEDEGDNKINFISRALDTWSKDSRDGDKDNVIPTHIHPHD